MKLTRLTALAIALFLPALAFAHTGADGGSHHGSAFIEGLVHPFTGLDHLAAMIAVGVWSALAFRDSAKRMWAMPVAFASLLLVGGLLAFDGLQLAGVEPMIVASLLVLGVMVATQIKLPAAIGATLVGAFAIFHGVAHGSELPAQQALAALSGMVLGTMSLHITGVLLGRFVLARNVWLPRIAGASVAVLGVSLLSGAI
ncbi:HupE/UreJ family protein [Uliginosibacterium sp. H3]|uniref:HupE/UreJ family protein n=1 Tax=Uliginosibacterium silvisoli TaxID=3114758 RepID=A0ABU6KAV4_9RHOO|nr:HupE/UreJ family protein [Uliginosibacterium sp. H3]